MKYRISSKVLGRLVAETTAAAGQEICGLLVGEGDDIADAWPLPNAAADPKTSFLFEPAALLAASRRAREEGRRIIGHYHSHPSGDPTPSRADAAMAGQPGLYWLIVSARRVRLWVARPGGTVHDSFDPVELEIV